MDSLEREGSEGLIVTLTMLSRQDRQVTISGYTTEIVNGQIQSKICWGHMLELKNSYPPIDPT